MKTNTTISLDTDVLYEAREKRINISGLVNEYLRNLLQLTDEDGNVGMKEVVKGEIGLLSAQLTQAKKKLEAIEKVEEENRPLRVYSNEA